MLLVDADIDAASSTAQLLQDQGCTVTLAMSLDQAVRVAALQQPHLVLIRVDLVDTAVIEAIRQTKAINTKLTPLFGCMTAKTDAASGHRWLQAGFDYVLNAPVEPRALPALVDSLRRLHEPARDP
ncbi:MAG: response regulator [Vitreoscilla sp.]|nr:response regulator [Vitreoscilla sp.]